MSDIEILYDDSKLLYERAKAAGVETELIVGHNMLHAWASIPQIPDSRKTLREMKTFFIKAGALGPEEK